MIITIIIIPIDFMFGLILRRMVWMYFFDFVFSIWKNGRFECQLDDYLLLLLLVVVLVIVVAVAIIII